VCPNAQKRGWHACPSKSIPAAEIEKFVVDQVRAVGRDLVRKRHLRPIAPSSTGASSGGCGSNSWPTSKFRSSLTTAVDHA